ncbi:MAG: type II secretion system protein GspD [Piscirickettsiaceae bacterium CG_4_9_14_3_um_filter_43_564]|nr:type II secretion system secretin GspD [Thiomicrospira sp.]PIQ03654.1 MAG: type II secretion system protein GspD [Piscirickettsiaceae bacterium CG18_big_fil_WC_8_21_14_2_50_44_103]PIU38995.1 MAG: type II secretion system protein GspD [Piscirickettsiaceae bacterium CG07_land_8_20_14_0_80_44_28]PIW57746.1 MAG: type II secretion system protein GspD [Piscirickettsiaceae bacterium CG12_big_fil_rev_8_21_14_0_65_44_934]PIW78162.1 MAG: type II secretion system protein GspD [Piscirickettsiaceae bacte
MKNIKRLFYGCVLSLGLNGLPVLVMAAPAAEAVTLQQNFQQAEIETVIEAVAKLTGRNFIIDPRVKGKVTLIAPGAMHPDDLYETLLAILRVHGFVAIPGKTAIQIVPANLARDQVPYENRNAEESDWVTEVIPVHKVDATKLVAVLRPLVAREGHLVALSDSNRLIVTDSVINIERIKAILKRVDVDETAGFEVIRLNHASASELVQVIKKMLPKSASSQITLTFDERTNRIVLSGDVEKRREVRTLIADLDISVPSEGRVQVVYLHYAKAKDLVPVLQKMAVNRSLLNSVSAEDAAASATSENAATGNKTQSVPVNQLDDKTIKSRISIEAEERVNAIVISAPPAVVMALKQVIKQLDIRRAQVLIEAILVEITETKQAELGIEWGAAGPNGVGLIDFSGTLPTLLGNIGNPLAQASALQRGSNVIAGEIGANGRGWGALLRALDSDSGANILSTPTLLTLDNEEAEIVVGKEVPFQTGSYTSSGTAGTAGVPTNPFNTIDRKNVGLSLKVKPQINEGNEVFLEIDQEVSDVIPKGDAVDIQTSKRQIKTSVMVGDGNIIVLGGLLTERETEVESKVPFLGDIPGLGALFRSTSSQREKVNLMVFLRPVIVRNSEMSSYYSRLKYSSMQEAQAEVLKSDKSLLEGLRPKMRTEQEWHDSAPVLPQPPADPEADVSKSDPTHLKAFEDL